MKPPGIALLANGTMRMRHPTQTEDAIWAAIETAIAENWTPQQFKDECADAWRHVLEDAGKEAQKVIAS